MFYICSYRFQNPDPESSQSKSRRALLLAAPHGAYWPVLEHGVGKWKARQTLGMGMSEHDSNKNRRDALEAERRREAEAILARAARDSDTVGDSALKRLGDHFVASDAEPTDRVEVWGKRIARGLALAAVLALLYHLVTTYLT